MYGRPYTALELLKKAENDRKIEEARQRKRGRITINSQYNSMAGMHLKLESCPQKVQTNHVDRVQSTERHGGSNARKHCVAQTAGRAGLKALEERLRKEIVNATGRSI